MISRWLLTNTSGFSWPPCKLSSPWLAHYQHTDEWFTIFQTACDSDCNMHTNTKSDTRVQLRLYMIWADCWCIDVKHTAKGTQIKKIKNIFAEWIMFTPCFRRSVCYCSVLWQLLCAAQSRACRLLPPAGRRRQARPPLWILQMNVSGS